MTFSHIPVLLNECLDGLNIKSDGVYIDATFGRGGHSRAILQRLGANGKLFAIDRDLQAIEAAASIDDERFCITHNTFSNIKDVAAEHGILGMVDGILMDIGVSSPQLDDAQRGFSFDRQGPLDMRMDNSCGLSAADIVNTYSSDDLSYIFKVYGEERFARKVAAAIVRERENAKIETTTQLASIISKSIPGAPGPKHKATRCFQALRIAVNAELDELKQALEGAIDVLGRDGRLCVISFHSLEDRIVKTFYRDKSSAPPIPRGLPITDTELAALKAQYAKLECVGKAIKASDSEIMQNVRSRSAVLRVAKRL